MDDPRLGYDPLLGATSRRRVSDVSTFQRPDLRVLHPSLGPPSSTWLRIGSTRLSVRVGKGGEDPCRIHPDRTPPPPRCLLGKESRLRYLLPDPRTLGSPCKSLRSLPDPTRLSSSPDRDYPGLGVGGVIGVRGVEIAPDYNCCRDA